MARRYIFEALEVVVPNTPRLLASSKPHDLDTDLWMRARCQRPERNTAEEKQK